MFFAESAGYLFLPQRDDRRPLLLIGCKQHRKTPAGPITMSWADTRFTVAP